MRIILGMKGYVKERIMLSLIGIVAGIANGFFGGGGGMTVVPMLVFLLGKPPKVAHATAILIILPLSAVSGFIYSVYGNFTLSVGLPASIGVVIGGIIGALALKKIDNKILVKVFAVVMLSAGIKLLFF